VELLRSDGVREEVVLARRVPLPRLRDEGDTSLLPDERRTLHFEAPGPVGEAVIEVRFERLRFLPEVAERAGVGGEAVVVLSRHEGL
jgi:hypothetical protein